MKTKLNILVVVIFLLSSLNAQGQFLKKLKERTKEAVEETITRKSADKAADETGKAMDKILNPGSDDNQENKTSNQNSESDADQNRYYDSNNKGSLPFSMGSKVDPIHKTNKYSYDWKYTLKMENKKQDIEMQYFMVDKGTDFATKYKMDKSNKMMDGMISIMDQKNNIAVSLFEMDGQKTGSMISMDFESMSEDIEEGDYDFGDYVVKELGTKNILGYECQGFQMENDENIITSYVAINAPVSFTPVFDTGSKQGNMAKGFDPMWFEKIGDDSIMMEMEFINKNKPKENFNMVCTELKKEKLSVDLADYNFMY